MSFVHLHTHSHFSLLDGLPKIDDLVARAKELGLPALALTDHGVLYGAVEFYQKARAAGVRPIIGVEAYLAHDKLTDRRPRVDERPYHLILLAKNLEGYRNILHLVTVSHLKGFYYKPRIDRDLLAAHHNGIIALSACLQGEIPRHILNGKHDDATRAAQWYQKVFGDDFFLELQHHLGIPEQETVNKGLKRLAKELGLDLVATNDSHYLRPEDAEAQDILMCIQTKKRIDDTDRMSYLHEDFSLRTPQQMAEAFADTPEAITNTLVIAERCTFELKLGDTQLPHFPTPAGKSDIDYLRELCWQGLETRYGKGARDRNDVMERLNFELSVIEKTGFASYFLIVQDFTNWAKSRGIVVGPGRGSAAGSIVSYLTNVTNVDPLRYELLFERFLNPDRISMPDIDIDFADARRDEVIRYAESRYGRDHVAQIITFGTMAARVAVRDVGRTLGLPYPYCDRVAKLIPMFTDLTKALDTVAELKEIYENDPDGRRLLDTAKKLEGVARHASRHACGVVITNDALENHVPLQRAGHEDDAIISQYSLHPIEDLGLLKMDFLGLSNLTILQDAKALVKKVRGIDVDLDDLPLGDKKTFELLQRGTTIGVFQLESSGMRRYLKALKPTTIEDIIAMGALYRPGPMEFIPQFIDGKNNGTETRYLHPKLKPILEKTYGVAVYQEQVMQIARDLAGFTMAEADVLRKAVGKKIAKLLKEQEAKFVEGCVGNGIERGTAEKVFAFIEPFARYGFNRSHAACYGLIAYQTAYFKANYPAEFMASLLSSDQHTIDRIAIEIEECRALGLEVLPPDVNESYEDFTVVPDGQGGYRIRFGLSAVKNVGDGVVAALIRERKEGGKFRTLEDFLTRVDTRNLNRKSLESLVKSGALDGIGERQQLLTNIEILLQFARGAERASENGQTNLFGSLPVEDLPSLKLRDSAAATEEEKLSWERELLGLFLSSHPLAEHRELLESITMPIAECGRLRNNATVSIGGLVTNLKKILTRTGEPMLFAKLEDMTGSLETIVFPSVLKAKPTVWQLDKPVLLKGKISDKDGQQKVLVNEAWPFDPTNLPPGFARTTPSPKPASGIALSLSVPATASQELYARLKALLARSTGQTPVFLTVVGDRTRVIETHFRVAASPAFLRDIETLLGKHSFHMNERSHAEN